VCQSSKAVGHAPGREGGRTASDLNMLTVSVAGGAALEMYAVRPYHGPAHNIPISGLFWGALIAVALVVALILVGKAIGRLRNRRGLDGGAVEQGPTKDVLTEIVAEVWHSDQQQKATKERRKRAGKAQKHQSEL
jgi:hypothetical protein